MLSSGLPNTLLGETGCTVFNLDLIRDGDSIHVNNPGHTGVHALGLLYIRDNCFPTLLDMLYNMYILATRNTHVKSLDTLENHRIPPPPTTSPPPPMIIMNKQGYLAPEPQFTIHLYIRIEHICIGEYRKLLFVCTYIAEFSSRTISQPLDPLEPHISSPSIPSTPSTPPAPFTPLHPHIYHPRPRQLERPLERFSMFCTGLITFNPPCCLSRRISRIPLSI